jgi:hypothetical protein
MPEDLIMDKALKMLDLIKRSQVAFLPTARWISLFAVLASLTFFASPRAFAQDPANADQQQQQAQPPDDQNAPPQQDQRRVISRDNIPQNTQAGPDQNRDQNPNDDAGPQQRNRRPYPRRQAVGDLPGTITIPAGKVIFVRLNQPLSSDHSHAGEGFTATLDQPIVVNGWVVARRGETVVGTVTSAKKAGRVKGVSQLGLTLSDITVVDGQQLPLVTEMWNGSAGTSHGADAAAIAGTTGVGTIIGAAANGGEGAGIGAGAGAAAGIAAVLLTRGKPTVLGPEARVSFRTKEPVTISTENSRQAFQPVGSDDYGNSRSLRQRPSGYAGGYPVAYPPSYAGCSPYWGCGPYYPYYGYYGPSVGIFYGGYWGGGFGHRGFGHGGFGHGGFHR